MMGGAPGDYATATHGAAAPPHLHLPPLTHPNPSTHSQDQLEVSPATLPGYDAKIKAFFEEHVHTDEEIRYVLAGGGECGGGQGVQGAGGRVGTTRTGAVGLAWRPATAPILFARPRRGRPAHRVGWPVAGETSRIAHAPVLPHTSSVRLL